MKKVFLSIALAVATTVSGGSVYKQITNTEYKIEYVLYGGQNDEDNPNNYKPGDTFEFNDATKVGHDFLGWYTSEEFDEESRILGITEDSTGDLVVHAKFEKVLSIAGDRLIGVTDYGAQKEELIIPSCIKYIETFAFKNCKDLKKVSFETGSELKTIGFRAFYYCDNLEYISLPDTIETIEGSAFKNETLDNLQTLGSSIVVEDGMLINKATNTLIIGRDHGVIPSYIEHIADYAFYNCKGLINIKVSANIKTIGAHAFSDCNNVKTIVFSQNSSLTKIGKYAFRNCDKVEQVMIPNSVTLLDNGAFAGCDRLNTVIFEDGFMMDKVSDSLFSNCVSLSNISLPSMVTEIGSDAFYMCESLEKMVIPSGVTKVGEFAFFRCKNLKSVKILGGKSEWSIKPSTYKGVKIMWEEMADDKIAAMYLSSTVLMSKHFGNPYLRCAFYRI